MASASSRRRSSPRNGSAPPAAGNSPSHRPETSTTRKRRARIASGSAISTAPSCGVPPALHLQAVQQVERLCTGEPLTELRTLAQSVENHRGGARIEFLVGVKTGGRRAVRSREQATRLARELNAGVSGRPQRVDLPQRQTGRGTSVLRRPQGAAPDGRLQCVEGVDVRQHSRRSEVGEQILGARLPGSEQGAPRQRRAARDQAPVCDTGITRSLAASTPWRRRTRSSRAPDRCSERQTTTISSGRTPDRSDVEHLGRDQLGFGAARRRPPSAAPRRPGQGGREPARRRIARAGAAPAARRPGSTPRRPAGSAPWSQSLAAPAPRSLAPPARHAPARR